MARLLSLVALSAALSVSAVYAADTKPLQLPPAPKPVPRQLPLNAQPTDKGVYIPVTKSGNTGVTVEGLANPRPGEAGGTVGIAIKTK